MYSARVLSALHRISIKPLLLHIKESSRDFKENTEWYACVPKQNFNLTYHDNHKSVINALDGSVIYF